MKRLVILLLAVSMPLFLARCGGGGPEDTVDASTSSGKDGGQTAGGDGSTSNPSEDGSTTQPEGDASTTQPGADGSTTQPEGDASTTQPGADGSTTQPEGDASTTQPGADGSTTQPEGDASTAQPGQDASTTQPTPDGGTTGPCDPFAQTGCSGGQKCSLDQTGAYVCVAAGSKGDQEDCTQESECAAGLACVAVQGETSMKCRAFCNATKKCANGQACVIGAPGGTSAILCAVVPACDPWAQTGCAANQKCTLADDTPTFTCGPAGTKGDLAACANDSECQAGLTCLDFSDGPKCHALCNDPARPCPTGQTCLGGTASSAEPFVCLPTPSCNPLTQDCPNATDGCFPKSQTEWACFHSMGKAAGEACTYANDCIEGFACPGGAGSTCMQICDPAGGAPTCTAPKTCAQFVTPAGLCN